MTKARLKVTICSYDGKDYFGGPYEWVKRIGPALREEGVEVSFLFFSDHKEADSSCYQYLKSKGFHCRILSNHSLTQYHDNTEDRVRWFLQQIKENPPDIMLANMVVYALYTTKWLKKAGIPVIGILHSDDPGDEYMYEEFLQGDPEFTLDAIVGVSALLSKRASASLANQTTRVATISCGTPVSSIKASYRKQPFKIVYAGKLTDVQKQITETTRVLCEVVKTLPGTEVEIYGSGTQSGRVQEIILTEGKGYPIAWKGLIASDQIQKVFAEAQLFVLLSDYEGMPVALMEAMAVGLVPLCTNIDSGIPELIEHEVSGLLVNDRKKDVLPAIQRLQEDSQLWNRLSKQAILKVQNTHSMNVVSKQWIQLFEQLISSVAVKCPVEIPDSIVLPPVNDFLKGIDVRKKPFIEYFFLQGRRALHYALKAIKLG